MWHIERFTLIRDRLSDVHFGVEVRIIRLGVDFISLVLIQMELDSSVASNDWLW